MSIKITVGGYEVQVGTPAEAAALLRELGSPQPLARSNPVQHTPADQRGHSPVDLKDADDLGTIFEFLDAIKAGGPNGATSKVVAHALDVKEKGIGSRLTWIRTTLNGLHFDDKDVFTRVKIPGVGRFWKPEHKFDAAYDVVRRKIGR